MWLVAAYTGAKRLFTLSKRCNCIPTSFGGEAAEVLRHLHPKHKWARFGAAA